MSVGGFDPNVLDAVLVLLLGYALLRGWRSGAVAQIGAFGGFALGLLAGVWLAPRVSDLFVDQPEFHTALLTLGVLLVTVLVGQGIGMGIAHRVRPAVYRAGIGGADRVLGLGISGAGLLLVVWLLASLFAHGPFASLAQQVRGSEIIRSLDEHLPPPPDVLGRISTYLADHGFPQVFAGVGGITAPPVPPATSAEAQAAATVGRPSTVQVRAYGCGGVLGAGSGFVTQPGFVVTNAHVIAGFGQLRVRDTTGDHLAVAIHLDPALDVAVLAAPDVQAPALVWASTEVIRGTQGATLGFPGGQSRMVARPATVQARVDAIGRDIYGHATVRREILALVVSVEQGDSGGPFVTSAGQVGGVVFAADPGDRVLGYALTSEQVRPGIDAAISRNEKVDVGACRF